MKSGSFSTKLQTFFIVECEAHTDFIRSVVVHPTLPYVPSAFDDSFGTFSHQSHVLSLYNLNVKSKALGHLVIIACVIFV